MAVIGIDDASFLKLLRERTADVVMGKPRRACDLVFLGARNVQDLEGLLQAKAWIEPNGAVWVVRPKGPGTPVREGDLFEAGRRAGLVDNKIASFSETQNAMRFVFRLQDRPRP